MSLKGGSNYKGAAKKISDHCGDTVFLRLTFKVTLLETPANCCSISRHALEIHHMLKVAWPLQQSVGRPLGKIRGAWRAKSDELRNFIVENLEGQDKAPEASR